VLDEIAVRATTAAARMPTLRTLEKRPGAAPRVERIRVFSAAAALSLDPRDCR
jgi:hypothetical protein